VRIAIFHDYFGAIGGGERVVLLMAKILDADIITTDMDAVKRLDPDARVISLGKTIAFPPLKQISATLKFYFCDFSHDYDLFIFTGNWSHAAAHNHHPNLWFCYTPVRAFYDLHPGFLKQMGPVSRQLFYIWVFFHRWFDLKSVTHVDHIIVISETVRNRLMRYHHRNANLIYPPVATTLYRNEKYENFWLSVNRLYPEKRIELQIETFRNLPEERLIIVGGYSTGDHAAQYAERIREGLPPNITLLGEVSDSELLNLYAHCKGHICTAIDEDFGLTPLEAMASGKAVVAVDEGGYRETITKDTGILVPADKQKIIRAIKTVSANPEAFKDACISHSKDFDVFIFKQKIIKEIDKIMSNDRLKKQ
jgi:glycosyltransferase involved in cell wall biosynthesis